MKHALTTVLLALSIAVAGCIQPLNTDRAPCPCASSFKCCHGVCVAESSLCGTSDAAPPHSADDGGLNDGGADADRPDGGGREVLAEHPGGGFQGLTVSSGKRGATMTYYVAGDYYSTFAAADGWETHRLDGVSYLAQTMVTPLPNSGVPGVTVGYGRSDLQFYDWTPEGWTIYQLLPSTTYGPWFVVARDSSGGLHLASGGSDPEPAPLVYRYWNGDTTAIHFTEEQVYASPASPYRLLLDSQGRPSLFFIHDSKMQLAVRREGGWEVMSVAGDGFGVPALSRRDTPVHCYATTGSTTNVYRVECVRLDGALWNTSRVVENLRVSGAVSVRGVAFDSADRIHLVYEVIKHPTAMEWTAELHYAHETSSGWSTVLVDTNIREAAGIVIDFSDLPLVVYAKDSRILGARPLGSCGAPPDGTLCTSVRCEQCPRFDGSCFVCSDGSWQATSDYCSAAEEQAPCTGHSGAPVVLTTVPGSQLAMIRIAAGSSGPIVTYADNADYYATFASADGWPEALARIGPPPLARSSPPLSASRSGGRPRAVCAG